jgi:Transposase, Mutator family
MHTLPRGKLRPPLAELKSLLAQDQDFLRPIVEAVLQELLEAEMTEALGAAKGERTPARLGYRAGYYARTLVDPGRGGWRTQPPALRSWNRARPATFPRRQSTCSARYKDHIYEVIEAGTSAASQPGEDSGHNSGRRGQSLPVYAIVQECRRLPQMFRREVCLWASGLRLHD